MKKIFQFFIIKKAINIFKIKTRGMEKKENQIDNEIKMIFQIDDFTKKFFEEKINITIEKAKERFAEPLLLNIKNMSTILKESKDYNRIEFETDFDFKTIEEILVSPEEKHPTIQNLIYVTVILFGKDKKIPMIYPYYYFLNNKSIENDNNMLLALDKKNRKKLKKKMKKKENEQSALNRWIFVNNKSEEALYEIKNFGLI